MANDDGNQQLLPYVDDYPPLQRMPAEARALEVRRRIPDPVRAAEGGVHVEAKPDRPCQLGTQVNVHVNVPYPDNHARASGDRSRIQQWMPRCTSLCVALVAVLLLFLVGLVRCVGRGEGPQLTQTGAHSEELSRLVELLAQYTHEESRARELAAGTRLIPQDTLERLLPPSPALLAATHDLQRLDGSAAALRDHFSLPKYGRDSVRALRADALRAASGWGAALRAWLPWHTRADSLRAIRADVQGRRRQLEASGAALEASEHDLGVVRSQLASACNAAVLAAGAGEHPAFGYGQAPEGMCRPAGTDAPKVLKGALSIGLAVCKNLEGVVDGVSRTMGETRVRAGEVQHGWWEMERFALALE